MYLYAIKACAIYLALLAPISSASEEKAEAFNRSFCHDILSPQMKEEIGSYKDVVEEIMNESTKGVFKDKLYSDLAYFVDTYGARLTGSDSLKQAAEYLTLKMEEIGLSRVHGEKTMIPKWIRGEEKAQMISPRMKELEVLGIGQTVPTPPGGIYGEVIAVDNYNTLIQKSNSETLNGKIILFNDESKQGAVYQLIGAMLTARMGGIAALVRSPTTFSLNTPHTGIQFNDGKTPTVPAAMLSTEDADLIYRLYQRGEKITVNLSLSSTTFPDVEGLNLIGDLEGREIPDEYVAVGAHYDSWDVGQGALDDGIGVALAWNVVNTLKKLRLIPRRTIRSLLFTGEELGILGARTWSQEHQDELPNYSAALEADYGCLAATGLLFSGSPQTGCILHEILESYFSKEYNISSLINLDALYTDIYTMSKAGVPSIVLNGDDGKYFYYHHTQADTMTALSKDNLDLCLGFWTALTYIIADLKEKLPR